MTPTTRSRLLRGAAALLILLILGVAGFYASRIFAPRSSATLPVTGTVEATQVDVSTKIVGRILSLRVRAGDRVTEGQLLVRLDDAELSADVDRSTAALHAAEAQLRDLLAGARQEEIEQAREALRSATATRVWTERDFRRVEELFKKEMVAAQDVDRARQAYEVAVAQERSARANLQLLEAGPRPHQVEAARAQVTQAKGVLDLARSRLRETTMVAPINGIVLRKNMEAGETANPGVSILTLMDPTDLWLRTYVAETDVGRLKLGMSARIKVDAFKDRHFPGRITEIASEAEFTPKNVQTQKERVNLVFRIKVAVDNPDGLLKPGMPADADILL